MRSLIYSHPRRLKNYISPVVIAIIIPHTIG